MGPYTQIRNTRRDDIGNHQVVQNGHVEWNPGIQRRSLRRGLRITIVPQANYASQVVRTPHKKKTNLVISFLASLPDTGLNGAFVPR